MWNGKKKAVTFSFDDGVEQDKRLVALFNQYQVKGTFNLNSGVQTRGSVWKNGDVRISRLNYKEAKDIYRGHEIASHGLIHQKLDELDEETLYNEIFMDKLFLETYFEQPVTGFAYPYGAYNDKVFRVLSDCGFSYARTVEATHSFTLQRKELLRFHPSFAQGEKELIQGVQRFLDSEEEGLQLLYIWGHSYELDIEKSWERMEELLKLLSMRDDIFYGTNAQVLCELREENKR